MIKILVIKQNNEIIAIEATGHSGYAEVGHDIVCSAVSVLTQNLAQGLSEVVGIKPKVVEDESIPHFSLTLPELNAKQMHEAQLLVRTTYLGLKDIANQFKKYVSIKEKNK